jgi:hypothetical protein
MVRRNGPSRNESVTGGAVGDRGVSGFADP